MRRTGARIAWIVALMGLGWVVAQLWQDYRASRARRTMTSEAASMSMKAPSAFLFNIGGHGYTILALAGIHGYTQSQAFALALGTQVPDLCTEYSATQVAWRSLLSWPWRQAVMASLHSLHGSNAVGVMARQRALVRRAMQQLGSGSDAAAIGVTLHALGDAFAHVRENGSAYGSWVGHLWAGHEPDHLTHNVSRYASYLRALNVVMKAHRPLPRDVAKRADAEVDSLMATVSRLTEPDSAEKAVLAYADRYYPMTALQLHEEAQCARFPNATMRPRIVALHDAMVARNDPVE